MLARHRPLSRCFIVLRGLAKLSVASLKFCIFAPFALGHASRWALQSMGPVFCKIGQSCAVDPDLPARLRVELAKLTTDVAYGGRFSTPLASVAAANPRLKVVERIGSGTVCEVFLAWDGETKLALKVVRPGIRQYVFENIVLLAFLCRLAERVSTTAAVHRAEASVLEAGAMLLNQVDMTVEAGNIRKSVDLFRDARLEWVQFPEVVHVTSDQLVMSFMEVRGFDRIAPALRPLLTTFPAVSSFFSPAADHCLAGHLVARAGKGRPQPARGVPPAQCGQRRVLPPPLRPRRPPPRQLQVLPGRRRTDLRPRHAPPSPAHTHTHTPPPRPFTLRGGGVLSLVRTAPGP